MSSVHISEESSPLTNTLSKFQFVCDDRDPSIPAPLPQPGFFLILVGQPSSGKTNLLLNLVGRRKRFYNRKFDRVFVFSPSLHTLAKNPFDRLPENQCFTDLTALDEVIARITHSYERVLLILDDLVTSIKKNDQQVLRTILNRRHLTGGPATSIIITTQVYNKLPLELRKNASHLVLFDTKNRKEIAAIAEELIPLPKDSFEAVLRHVFTRRFEFLYLVLNQPASHMFYRKFNRLILEENIDNTKMDVA